MNEESKNLNPQDVENLNLEELSNIDPELVKYVESQIKGTASSGSIENPPEISNLLEPLKSDDSLPETFKEILSDTPGENKETVPQEEKKLKEERKYLGRFNTVEDLENAYKELQREYNKLDQRVKRYENYASLIDLLEKDERIKTGIARFLQEQLNKLVSGNKEEEEDVFGFQEEEKTQKLPDISVIREIISNIIERKFNEIFGALNTLRTFAQQNNLNEEELNEIVSIAKKEGLSLDEAFEKYQQNLKALEERILKKYGIDPKTLEALRTKRTAPNTFGELSNLSVPKPTTGPASRGTGITGAGLGKSWEELTEKEKMELLKYFSNL